MASVDIPVTASQISTATWGSGRSVLIVIISAILLGAGIVSSSIGIVIIITTTSLSTR